MDLRNSAALLSIALAAVGEELELPPPRRFSSTLTDTRTFIDSESVPDGSRLLSDRQAFCAVSSADLMLG